MPFLFLNVKSTYGTVLFFGTILPSSFWGFATSNTELKSFSWDELKCQIRSTALLLVGGVGTGREKRAYDMRGHVNLSRQRCGEAMLRHSAPPKPHLKRDTFPRILSTLKPHEVRSLTVKNSDLKRAVVRLWSTGSDLQIIKVKFTVPTAMQSSPRAASVDSRLPVFASMIRNVLIATPISKMTASGPPEVTLIFIDRTSASWPGRMTDLFGHLQ